MENKDNEKMEFGAVVTPSGIVVPDIFDKKQSSSKWVKWGADNKMPLYLWDNYLKCSNLQAIVNTIVDYVFGKGIETDYKLLSDEDETLEEVIRKCILDKVLFGGFSIEGIRDRENKIARLNYQNVMNVRVNEDLDTAFISNKWNSWNQDKVVELPLFNKNEVQNHFLMYDRGSITRGINPIPMYAAAMKSIAILNNTRNFHLKNLENGFTANVIINLNNGNIKQRELDEIKEKLEKGYCGTENAGKFILLNNQDKEHSATILRLDSDKFGELYHTLEESSTNDIYAAFRINPMLVGINVNTGFSKEEFQNAYELFYTTVCTPMQDEIKRAFKKIGITIEFKPFEINWRE